MSSALFRVFTHRQQPDQAPQKKGTVTGVQDRSEVESMIQRYLELAQSALKDDSDDLSASRTEEELSA